MAKQYTKILCMDFDGVIHSYTSGWKGAGEIPDPPVPGAINFLMAASGPFEVHIFSARSGQDGGVPAMQRWLTDWIKRENPDITMKEAIRFAYQTIKWPTTKPPAFVTIDDRTVQFEGTFPLIDELLDFKPWYKRG